MDINVDQNVPRDDMVKLDSGLYKYRLEGDKFEIDRFNRDFEQYKERRKIEMKKKLDKKLEELNKPEEPIPIFNQSIGQILIQTKDALFNILDDLLQFKFTYETVLKDDRIFHLGITIVLITIFLLLYTVIVGEKTQNNNTAIKIKLI